MASVSYRLCLVGLGNPGPQYERTRHNLGFRLIDSLRAAATDVSELRVSSFKNQAEAWQGQWCGEKILMLKPTTFMNNSGIAVREAVRWFRLDTASSLMLAYDDLDIPLGSVRLRAKGSAGTHNGMASVVQELGSADFPRVRMGIGPKPPVYDAADFVLSRFSAQEEGEVKRMIEKAQKLLEIVLTGGMELALSKYND